MLDRKLVYEALTRMQPAWVNNTQVTGPQLLEYVQAQEARMIALAAAVADHLEGKPIKPPEHI